jgi:hypothetical protein
MDTVLQRGMMVKCVANMVVENGQQRAGSPLHAHLCVYVPGLRCRPSE